MFESGNVYKIEVTGNVFLQKVEKGNSYTIYISGNSARFLRPRGVKVLFQHTLQNVNNWLYDHCDIEKIETIEEWKQRVF
jgi:hypothetical protein